MHFGAKEPYFWPYKIYNNTEEMKMLVIGSDHGGFLLKQEIRKHLEEQGIEFVDVGCYDEKSVDYPDIAKAACDKIVSGECAMGILICGTGIGISMAANKVKGIRAACCSDCFSAKFTRLHNDANVLCFGGRVVGPGLACMMVDEFLHTEFEGGRHQRRIDKLTALENR